MKAGLFPQVRKVAHVRTAVDKLQSGLQWHNAHTAGVLKLSKTEMP
jgi:hypothetical protein